MYAHIQNYILHKYIQIQVYINTSAFTQMATIYVSKYIRTYESKYLYIRIHIHKLHTCYIHLTHIFVITVNGDIF